LNHYADIVVQKTLMSNLHSTDINEYMEGLELEGKQVDVRRVKSDADAAFLVEGTQVSKTIQSMTNQSFDYEHLPVPRKPEWNKKMNAGEVDHNERAVFLEWRRKLALMEESNNGKYRITPFEKNLEVWRQLWRVLEKSDIGVQVVDARNPLLYYTEDLLNYASECDCPTLLVVNKADFLTEYQRKAWAEYFDKQGVQFVFYSAANEQKYVDTESRLSQRVALDPDEIEELEQARFKLQECETAEAMMIAQDVVDRMRSTGTITGHGLSVKPTDKKAAEVEKELAGTATEQRLAEMEKAELLQRRCRVLRRQELVLLLEYIPKALQKVGQARHQGRVCVGLMGFPNVGKSSCINSILAVSKSTHGQTRVAVSATPGKTKHFQTLVVNDGLMLCDCPGLVFPSFMRSTGEMLCAGILPINQMREYLEPANVITSRVSMHLIEATYGITIRRDLDIKDKLDRPPTGSEMLCAFCKTRGFITAGTGRWDEFRACKEIIRDFCDGLLLFIAPPDQGSTTAGKSIDYKRWLQDTENVMQRSEKIADRLALQRLADMEKEGKLTLANLGSKGITIKPTDMVFGDGKWQDQEAEAAKATEAAVTAAAAGKKEVIITPTIFKTAEELLLSAAIAVKDAEKQVQFQYDDESSESEGEGGATGTWGGSVAGTERTENGTVIKREHKKIKHWGKKNKKLRDKNPYGEENGKVAYALTTSRVKSGYSTTRATPLVIPK